MLRNYCLCHFLMTAYHRMTKWFITKHVRDIVDVVYTYMPYLHIEYIYVHFEILMYCNDT